MHEKEVGNYPFLGDFFNIEILVSEYSQVVN